MRAARANMRAPLHIQHRPPNDRAYRAPIWNKHSLRQCVELMGVGDPECALIRAQTCAQPCTSSIDGQTTGPIEPQIGTNIWGSIGPVLERVIRRSRSFVQPPTDTGSSLYYISLKWSLFCVVLSSIGGQTAGPIGTKIGTNTHWDYATDSTPNWYKNPLEQWAQVMGVAVSAARAACNRGGAYDLRERGARERARSTRVQGWNRAHQLPRTLRAQTCAQTCSSSLDGQTTRPIETQIGTNTHWDNG
jgi:hypothetical protein